jgi:hypothetical protein
MSALAFPERRSVITERVERQLTAILAAEVAGYSRLMGANEEGTRSRPIDETWSIPRSSSTADAS